MEFLAPYVFSFAKKLVDGTVNAKGTLLTVHTYTEFTNHSAAPTTCSSTRSGAADPAGAFVRRPTA